MILLANFPLCPLVSLSPIPYPLSLYFPPYPLKSKVDMFVGQVLPSLRHRWGYECSFDAKRPNSGGFVGLKNQGCTCYMNSLLQQASLYHRQERVRGWMGCGSRSYRYKRPSVHNGLVQFSSESDALCNQGRMTELLNNNFCRDFSLRE